MGVDRTLGSEEVYLTTDISKLAVTAPVTYSVIVNFDKPFNTIP